MNIVKFSRKYLKTLRRLRSYTIYLAILPLAISCIPQITGYRSSNQGRPTSTPNVILPNDNSSSNALEIKEPKSKLVSMLDPYDGNYKTKITIPKNFSGTLLIAGRNISKFKKNESLWVRFRFGRNLTSFVLPAWIAHASVPGLTGTSTIKEILHVDLSGAPFNSLRLNNHLYDYNQYKKSEEPVTDPFDDQLYCRALSFQHDPTSTQSSTISQCRQKGDRCLYSYAQVFDQGLHVRGYPIVPKKIQFALNDNGLYRNESEHDLSQKCLADNRYDRNTLGNTFAIPAPHDPGPVVFTIGQDEYRYRGPYEARNTASWQIKGGAITGADSEGNYWGLFEQLAHPLAPSSGFYSLKFPRAGRLPVRDSIQYVGENTIPTVSKHPTRGFNIGVSETKMSQLMDGCNLRVAHLNSVSHEGIDSCNVTALIELVRKDKENNQYVLLGRVSETELKVQLIRRTTKTPLTKKELVSANFRTCDSNNACGKNECCYNKRCWSKNIVTQCLVDSSAGQLSVGKRCTDDLQCASLCCSHETRTCQGHDGDKSLCSKPIRASCIADEFCTKVFQTEYHIVKTSQYAPSGEEICELHPKNVYVFANCVRRGNLGICMAPQMPIRPKLDNSKCPTSKDSSAASSKN